MPPTSPPKPVWRRPIPVILALGTGWVVALGALAIAATGATISIPIASTVGKPSGTASTTSAASPTSFAVEPTPTAPSTAAPTAAVSASTPASGTPPSSLPGQRVETGFLLPADLPGDLWQPVTLNSSPWLTRQSTAWGGRALISPTMRTVQLTLGVADTADTGRLREGWRDFLSLGDQEPAPLRTEGRRLIAATLAIPNAYTQPMSLETSTPVADRATNPVGAAWAFDITATAAHTPMTVDAFEWRAGRLATLLIVIRGPQAPPLDLTEVLRKARARLDDAQKAN